MESVIRGSLTEFQCRLKHVYSLEDFLSAHAKTEERALWAAVAALEEGVEMANRIHATPHGNLSDHLQSESHQKQVLAGLIRVLGRLPVEG
jgi:hypothetical protein